jgi:hypothetical protein
MDLELKQFAAVGFDHYRQEYKIVANRRPAKEIVAKISGVRIEPRSEQSGFGFAASGTLRQRAEQLSVLLALLSNSTTST